MGSREVTTGSPCLPLEQGHKIDFELVGVTPWAPLLLEHLLGDRHWRHPRVLAAELGALLRLLVDVVLDAVDVESVAAVVEPEVLALLTLSIPFEIVAVRLLIGKALLGDEGAPPRMADELLLLLLLLDLVIQVSLTLVAEPIVEQDTRAVVLPTILE